MSSDKHRNAAKRLRELADLLESGEASEFSMDERADTEPGPVVDGYLRWNRTGWQSLSIRVYRPDRDETQKATAVGEGNGEG